MSPRPRCDETAAWRALAAHRDGAARGFDLRRAFEADPGRFERFSQEAAGLFADLSKNLLDARTQDLLWALARECGFGQARAALLGGETVNPTEGRAAKHWLLRTPRAQSADADAAAVHEALDAFLAFAEQVRADGQLRDVVNIGIGGSDLGPRMAVAALAPFAHAGKRLHFVSSLDGHELAALLPALRPEGTLFVVSSKSFTTQETLTNARSARRWFEAQGGHDIGRHFVAVTGRPAPAQAFGIRTIFPIWDWVGGRYSLWSAIGLPLAVAIGAQGFRSLLAGAHAMDCHFEQAPPERNLPLRMALIDIWHRNFLGFPTRSVAPYHVGLRRLPAYLQQLEMESNGKRVDLSGRPLAAATSPVVWGEAGTDGQHAYFQMLHQGTDVVPVEFIAVKAASHGLPDHHLALLSHAVAQSQALMLGRPDAGGHRDLPGNRPSSFLILPRLDPQHLGALLALYEHRVFSSGALWGIDSFDQWGVEFGKTLAADLEPRLASGDATGLDGSTAGLVGRLRS